MSIIFINVGEEQATFVECRKPEEVANALNIPVIAEIEPQPDPLYGHTFKWPAEVAQFLKADE